MSEGEKGKKRKMKKHENNVQACSVSLGKGKKPDRPELEALKQRLWVSGAVHCCEIEKHLEPYIQADPGRRRSVISFDIFSSGLSAP